MDQVKQDEFWKRKLMTFLHDPPHKPYGIINHEATIKSNLNTFGLTEEDMKKFSNKFSSDAFAASADRFIFPNPRKKYNGSFLRTDWKEEGAPFIHPFCGTKLKPHELPVTGDVTEDWMSSALGGIIDQQKPTKENFFKAWRLWEKRLSEQKRQASIYMPYLVADTRIPDHTIWEHNALTSAIASCNNKPAFLLFQIGPVQSFIAQAKTTRDLWAGSYILSYLNAKAMYYVAYKYGPDHIIFPQIKGNPIVDKLFWDIYGEKLDFTDEAKKNWEKKQLLIPSLPNRFMALVPSEDKDLENDIKDCVRDEWSKIHNSVRKFVKKQMDADFPDWDELWDEQVNSFPRMDSIIHEFEPNDKIIDDFLNQTTPPFNDPDKHPAIQNLKWALKSIEDDFKDSRCYKNRYDKQARKYILLKKDGSDLNEGDEISIDNIGFTWSLQYLKAEWKFGALRNSRCFNQRFSLDKHGYQNKKRKIEKDPLDGVNEILGGEKSKEFWNAVFQNSVLKRYFKGKQHYGALSIIKRLFAKVYLSNEDIYNVNSEYKVKSTYEIATGRTIDDDEELKEEDNKYYAVICLDGDSMGKWLSGDNSQEVQEQLLGKSIKEYFADKKDGVLKRAITPSYHLSFSEALANFANYCVEPIISKFEGQLIYAGGDDVLAMVPAAKAIECSEALQYAFRGEKPFNNKSMLYEIFDFDWSEMNHMKHANGFLKFINPGSARPKYPIMVPGSKSTVSVGIAVGHLKSPMQDLIQTARDAEEYAKDSGKDGFCLTIKKRSGETNSFFAGWNNLEKDIKTLSAWRDLTYMLQNKQISNRYPYVYVQYISSLLRGKDGKYLKTFDDDLRDACREFLRITNERQGEGSKINFEELFGKFCLEKQTPENFVNFWMCLAFMNRISDGGE